MKKAFLLALSIIGCSGSEFAPEVSQPSKTCTPGQVIECPCTSGAKGTQTCGKDGYDTCQCPDQARKQEPATGQDSGAPAQDAAVDNQVPQPGLDAQTPAVDSSPGTDSSANPPDSSPPIDAGVEAGQDAEADTAVVVDSSSPDAGADAPADAATDSAATGPWDPSSPLCKGVWGVDGFAGVKGQFPPGPCASGNGINSTAYTYGDCGRPVTEKQCRNGGTMCNTITYAYDGQGHLVSKQNSDTGFLDYVYLNDGKHITVEEGHRSDGSISTKQTLSYDSHNRVAQRENEHFTRLTDGTTTSKKGILKYTYQNGTLYEILFTGSCVNSFDGVITFARSISSMTANYLGEAAEQFTIGQDWNWRTKYPTFYIPTDVPRCVQMSTPPSLTIKYAFTDFMEASAMNTVYAYPASLNRWYKYEYDNQLRETARLEYKQDPATLGVTAIARVDTTYDTHGNIIAKGPWIYDYSCWYR